LEDPETTGRLLLLTICNLQSAICNPGVPPCDSRFPPALSRCCSPHGPAQDDKEKDVRKKNEEEVKVVKFDRKTP